MRFYRKSDADLLATIMEERDRLAHDLQAADSAREMWHTTASNSIEESKLLRERIRTLEAANEKFFQQQNETVKTLLAKDADSNAPVVWPDREQVKMNAAPPRSLVGTLKARVIQNGLKNQKKPESVQ
jgi:hypothetical protein